MAPPVVTDTERGSKSASLNGTSDLSELMVPKKEPKAVAATNRGVSGSLDEHSLHEQSFGTGADLRREERAARESREMRSRGGTQTSSQQVAPQAETTSWWQRISNAVSSFAEGAKLLVQGGVKLAGIVTETMFNPTTWSSIGNFLTDRQTWQRAGDILSSAAVIGLDLLKKGAIAFVTDPIGAIKTAVSASWGVAKNISDAIGLTRAVNGLWQLATAPARALYTLATTGSLKAAGATLRDGLKAGVDGLVGAGQVFCEVVGLADAYHAIKHTGLGLISLAKGDKLGAAAHFGQAVMHGAFAAMSAGALVATVATGGAAAGALVGVYLGRTAIKQVLKQGVKQGLKAFGKELGERAVKEIGTETLSKAGREIAESTGKEVLSQLEKQVARNGGVLTGEMMQVLTRQIAETNTGTVLKKLDLEKIVVELGEDLFQAVSRKDKNLLKKLCDAGIPKKEAKNVLKDMDGILRGRNGKLDAQMLGDLTESITPAITEALCKESASVYGKIARDGILKSPILREAAERGAKKQGVDLTRYVDDLVDAGKAGYREGVERGVSKIVSRALKTALKQFRRFRPNLDMDSADKDRESGFAFSGKTSVEELVDDSPNKGKSAREADRLNTDALPRKFEVTVLDDGTRVVNEYILLGHNGDEGRKLISSERFTPDSDPTLNKKRGNTSKK